MNSNYGYANVLKHLNRILEKSCPKDALSDSTIYNEARKAYDLIENEIAKQAKAEISKLKKLDITKIRQEVINNMLKELLRNNAYAKSSVSRISTPWYDNEGRVCATDRYRIFRFNPGVYPIVGEISHDADPELLNSVWNPLPEKCTEALDLPDLASLKRHIVIESATRHGYPIYKFPMASCATFVNAKYLLDLMLVFPEVYYLYREPGNPLSPLIAKGADGDAILLPINMKKEEEEE